MTRYKLKLERYVLPDAIKKSFKSEELKQSEKEKDYIENRIKEINTEINKPETTAEKKRELENELYSLNNQLSTIINNIFNIKADIYGSIVNFNNANINQLSTTVSNIESIIKDPSKFNEEISKQITQVLTSQADINKIFEGVNFKALLEEIKNNVSETNKINFQNEFNNLVNLLEEIKNNPKSTFENQQRWEEIKNDVKDLIKTEDLRNIINEFTNKVNEIALLKSELNQMIFKKDTVDNVAEKELKDYIQKFSLLSDLYFDSKRIIENKKLTDLGFDKKGYNDKGKETGPTKKMTQQLNLKGGVPEFKRVISNLRKWFSNSKQDFTANEDILIKEMFIDKDLLFNYDKIKNIELDDINEAYNVIESLKSFIKEQNEKNKNDDQNVVKENSAGLDLDEIHNLNIMNNIIKSLNDINETLKGIKETMLKQNPESKKLGRFKVEKYNPNMSIVEFKKLFNKED